MSRTFRLKSLLILIAVFAISFAVVYPRYAAYKASVGMACTVRALQQPYRGYRLLVAYDHATSQARVVVIEKNDAPPQPNKLEPSFCTVVLSENSALVYINGKPTFPTSELVAYFAEAGRPPKRVVLDRNDYTSICQDSIMPQWSDQALWDLCTTSASIP